MKLFDIDARKSNWKIVWIWNRWKNNKYLNFNLNARLKYQVEENSNQAKFKLRI